MIAGAMKSNKNKVLILIAFLIVAVLAIPIIYTFYLLGDDNQTSSQSVIIDFKEIGKKAFLQARVFGISGNHEEIVLSEKEIELTNKKKHYVFYTSEIYYKIDGQCEITIYTPTSYSEPIEKFSVFKVNLVKLLNYDEIEKYRRKYKEYGLQKINVYGNKNE